MFLLRSAVGIEKAKEMVCNVSHEIWKDNEILSKIRHVLGDAEEVITAAASNVARKLQRLEQELGKLDHTCEEDSSEDSSLQQHHRKTIRARFRFVFSEAKLAEFSTAISNANNDFRILRKQIQEVSKSQPTATPEISRVDLKKLDATRAAAERVYYILAKACTVHTRHQARFSLEPFCEQSGEGLEIKFTIALSQISIQASDSAAIWFVVESFLSGSYTIPRLTSTCAPGDITMAKIESLVTVKARPSVGHNERPKKRVRFSATSSTETLVGPFDSADLPDLCMNRNLCTHLRSGCRATGNAHRDCLGWLGKTDEWKHKLFPSMEPRNEAIGVAGADTLAKLLTTGENGQKDPVCISMARRLRLAKTLATAVLNFHATPWMQSTWTSSDILLYSSIKETSPQSDTKYSSAFVEVPLRDMSAEDQQNNAFEPDFVANMTMFSLGVILLELAFLQPLRAMRAERDISGGFTETMTDFQTAMRKSLEASRRLGRKYSTIIGKCLRCDFGQGQDLRNPDLRAAVHRDVVLELEKLEMAFSMIEI